MHAQTLRYGGSVQYPVQTAFSITVYHVQLFFKLVICLAKIRLVHTVIIVEYNASILFNHLQKFERGPGFGGKNVGEFVNRFPLLEFCIILFNT